MSIPPAVPREELHHRRIDCRGYRRHDGLYDIEGRVTDLKAGNFDLPFGRGVLPEGKPLHDMWVRMTVDEDLLIHDIIASTESWPWTPCPEASAAVSALKGVRIGPGFLRAIRDKLGGAKGCTHIAELLPQVATTAFQTLSPVRSQKPDRLDATGRPVKIDSCYAYSRHRELVRDRWPAFYEPEGKSE